MAGWISLHRKLMDNPIYSNANMLKLWIHCLMKATHAEREQLVGNQMVKLEVGQFVTGRNALAEEFNKGAKKDEVVSPSTLWRWLNNFEEWQMLNIKKTTKYSVVTVVHWSEYQGSEQQVNSKWTANEQQMNNKRTTDEQQVNTNNNVNNANNINKDNKHIEKPDAVNPFRFYEQEGFGTLSSFTADTLGDLIDRYHEEPVLSAMKEAVTRGARNLKYVEAILKNPNKGKSNDNVHPFKPKQDEYKYDYGF